MERETWLRMCAAEAESRFPTSNNLLRYAVLSLTEVMGVDAAEALASIGGKASHLEEIQMQTEGDVTEFERAVLVDRLRASMFLQDYNVRLCRIVAGYNRLRVSQEFRRLGWPAAEKMETANLWVAVQVGDAGERFIGIRDASVGCNGSYNWMARDFLSPFIGPEQAEVVANGDGTNIKWSGSDWETVS